MIKIDKSTKPQTLVAHEAEWRSSLLREPLDSPVPKKYRDYYKRTDIKRSLIEESSGKCAYCERKILANQFGDVEHIIPISKDRSLMFEWTNLVLACELCNSNKSNYAGQNGPIIDPVSEDPQIHIYFLGPSIQSKDHKGRVTIDTLKLNRTTLMEQRNESITRICEFVAVFLEQVQRDSTKLGELNYILEKECSSEKEFSAAIRHAVTYLVRNSPGIRFTDKLEEGLLAPLPPV